MKFVNENRIIAAIVLVVALITLFSTVSPTVSFWDPGERIAASYLVQVPHPPGAPLFILVGRVMSMIPFAEDAGFRVNTISVLAGAFTVMLLYLMVTRMIYYFRGRPETIEDKLIVYGSGVIGALSLLWSQTFWFNATEAETYATSLFLSVLVVWLGFLWYDKADRKGSERYLLLGAYIIGLSIGVHLLSVLAIFPVALIVYFKRFEPDWGSFIKYGLGVVALFFVVYPGIVKWFPSMLDGNLAIGNMIQFRQNTLLQFVPLVIVIGAIYGVYYSIKHHRPYLNLAMLGFLLISFGFTTYATVLIRANANPPMNQNQPDNLNTLVSYLNREQYGDVPLFDRRWNPEPVHQQYYMQYNSDFDYLLRYQVGHMYVRYLTHNFIGREGDWQDAGIDWKGLYGLPFLLGLIGAYYHIRRDWKWGMTFLAFFVLMGFALAFVFNMAEPQPRERDYFFAGSFFVFAGWIGFGSLALLEMLKNALKAKSFRLVGIGAGLVVLFIASPVNLLTENYHERDRSGHYIAWDYGYNLLQSVERDAILFTNGDNDTFPLWYLQDVEGIRTDVRVVNLSLLNTSWYINQLKNLRPHGAKPVPISLTEAQIEQIRPMQFEPRDFELRVPAHVYEEFGVSGPENGEGRIIWRMPNTREFNNIPIIRVQDFMVRDIIMTTGWERPLYFAVTIPDNGSKIGIDEYLRLDGLVQRLTPVRHSDGRHLGVAPLEKNLFDEPETFSREPRFGYKFRGLSDPSVFLEEQSRRLTINYRNAFLQLAMHYHHVEGNHDRSIEVLDRMEEVIPRDLIEISPGMLYEVASLYRRSGREETFIEITDELVVDMQKQIDVEPRRPLTMSNPYLILFNLYNDRAEYAKEKEVLDQMLLVYGDNPDVVRFVRQRMDQLEILMELEDSIPEPVDTMIVPDQLQEN
jgi:hypothetical protein